MTDKLLHNIVEVSNDIKKRESLNIFSPEDLDAIVHAVFYEKCFQGRIAGHNQFVLIAKLVEQLEEYAQENNNLNDLLYSRAQELEHVGE